MTHKDCKYLTKVPEGKGKHTLEQLRRMYLCELTDKPCIARDEIRPAITFDGINDDEVYFGIHKYRISCCPARDLPKDLALQILEHHKKLQLEKLRREYENKKVKIRSNSKTLERDST